MKKIAIILSCLLLTISLSATEATPFATENITSAAEQLSSPEAENISSSAGERFTSPNGRLQASCRTTPEGTLYYDLVFDGDTLIRPSRLGLLLDHDQLLTGFEILNTERTTHDETWTPV